MVLVHVVVAVHHVLAQTRAVARRYDDLADIGADVHDLRHNQQCVLWADLGGSQSSIWRQQRL